MITLIIDFHTHIFPDTLAPRAFKKLTECLTYDITPSTDMTKTSLIKSMDEANIDISVVHPVITKPSQLIHTNEFSKEICDDRIISFGGIHPDTDDFKNDIDFVKSLGLKGLKFHAEYQNFILDEERMLKIYDYAFSKDLIVIHHAGLDAGMPPPYKSNPEMFLNVIRKLKGGIMIAAHFGGHKQWEDVYKYLAGEDIYLDTSMGFDYFTDETFIKIMNKHGSDKILFASDSPWSNAKNEIKRIKNLNISTEDKDNILYKNAKRLLKI